MTAKGHQLLAAATTIPIFHYINSYGILDKHSLTIAGIGVFIGSVFPDIDEPNSYIGRRVGFLSEIIHLFVKHRGFTHSLLFVLLVLVGAFTTGLSGADKVSIFLYGLSWGILMHDVGDMLTKGGINGFFYPIYDGKIALLPYQMRFYTGSIIEILIILMLFGIIVFELYLFIPNGMSLGQWILSK